MNHSQRCLRSNWLVTCAVTAVATLVVCLGVTAHAARTVQYRPAQFVKPPPVLTGDPGDHRCADTTAPCFQGNTDFTNGQRRMLRIEDIGIGLRTRQVDEDYKDIGNHFFLGGKITTANGGPTVVNPISASVLTGAATDPVSSPAVVRARLFNGATDMLVSAVANVSLLSVAAEGTSGPIAVPPGVGLGLQDRILDVQNLFGATADFNGDGFDDVVFALSGTHAKVQVMYAVDGDKPASGIAWGPAVATGASRVLAMATGNFLGTGYMVATAVVLPDQTLWLQYFDVDPSTRQLTQIAALILNRPAGALPASYASIAVGRFNPGAFVPFGHDQMVIAVSDAARTDLLTVDAASASGASPLTPVQRLQGTSDDQVLMRPVVRAGRFDWSSAYDGAALLLTDNLNVATTSRKRLFTLLALDANLDVAKQSPDYVFSAAECVYDLQLGNFDRRRKDSTPNAPANATLHDPNLQMAVLVSTATNGDPTSTPDNTYCSGADSGDTSKGLTVLFYDINVDSDGTPSVVGPQASIEWSSSTEARVREAYLAVPDLQGRSLVLGTPTILTVTEARQLTASIAAPPMHADFIDGKLTNLTVAPDGFSAQFSWSNSGDNKITGTDTTSYTNAFEEKVGASVSYGAGCGLFSLGGCVTADVHTAFSQQLTNTSTTMNGKYSSWNLQVQTATALDDLIAYSESTVTFYFYPVLGKTICPGSRPDCAPSDRKQATVVFSAPDSVTRGIVDASLVPWYQPPWMPGNVLSYPGTVGQLQAAAYPDDPSTYQPLSNGNQTWATDQTTGTQQNTWSNTSTAGSTVSSGHNYQYQAGVSVSGSWNADVASGKITSSFDYTHSDSAQNVVDSTTNLSQSSGVLFTKQAQFADPGTYAYRVTPSIFGKITPPTAPDAFTDQADLTSFGALRVGYIVDLLGTSGGGETGSFWSSERAYRSAPDIAFNQPRRWTSQTFVADRHDGTCLLTNRTLQNFNCVSLTTPQPAEPFNDEYHHMRGFYITGTKAGGPQLSVANAGDQLVLQVRVHNFSFKPTPLGATLKVRFYAMPWDIGNAQPAGASVAIGTVATSQPVPPYTNTGAPNWIVVAQPFDTTRFANQDLVFWAVTWMEDSQGNLLGELPGKGLTSIPATGLDFAGVAVLEEAYGNNLGLYHQVFHVFDPQASSAARAKATRATEPTVAITEVGSHVTSAQLGETVLLGARIRAAAAHPPKSGLTVHFVDGDPAQGGTVVGLQHLSFLKGGSTHEYRVNFRPKQCGERSLYVVAGPGTRFEHVAKLGEIDVACPYSLPPDDGVGGRCPAGVSCRER